MPLSPTTYNIGAASAALVARYVHFYVFGDLRVDETASLITHCWLTAVEFGIAASVIQEPLSLQLIASCVLIAMLKWFHQLSSLRVGTDYDDWGRSRTKIGFVLTVLHTVDFVWIRHYFRAMYRGGSTTKSGQMMVVFAFELAVLYSSLLSSSFKYAALELTADPSDFKSMVSKSRHNKHLQPETALTAVTRRQYHHRQIYVSCVGLLFDVVKLLLYSALSFTMLYNRRIPLHIIRDMYVTLRTFVRNLREFIWFCRLMSSNNVSFHRMTTQDSQNEFCCMICRDDIKIDSATISTKSRSSKAMQVDTPVRLLCLHVLHYGCMMQWLQRSRTCPICRHALA